MVKLAPFCDACVVKWSKHEHHLYSIVRRRLGFVNYPIILCLFHFWVIIPFMSTIEEDAQKSIVDLNTTNGELARGLAEVDFGIKYDEFLGDGKPRVLFSGIFIGNDESGSILYEKDNKKHIFPYGDLEQQFISIFVDHLQGELSDYRKKETRTILTQTPNIPEALFNFIGKEVKTEITSYFIRSMGDRKIRKIEHTRYFYPENKNLPFFEIWEAKSVETSGVSPSNGAGRKIPVFQFQNKN